MQDSLKGRKILITGITGFVGSHLAARLKKLGARVYGISRSVSDTHILKASVLDCESVSNFIRSKRIEIVFHLAGESLVERGQEDPYGIFTVNTQGALTILECARKYNFEKVIVASTVHVYGKNKVPYLESYTPKPSRPYETSKACTDLIAQSYADTYNLPVLIPRFVNIYGPGDLHFHRLIPRTIRTVLLNEQPTMWGGNAIRDYLYIDDAIEAYLKLAQVNVRRVGDNRIFNFGSGSRITVKELVEKIILLSGKKLKIKKIPQERSDEILAQYVSWNKATKLLGFEPKITLDEGLKRTIAWYKRYL